MKHIFMFPFPWAVAREIKQNQDSKPTAERKAGIRFSVFLLFLCPSYHSIPLPHLFAIGSEDELGRAGLGPFPPALCGGKGTGSAVCVTAPPNSHCWPSIGTESKQPIYMYFKHCSGRQPDYFEEEVKADTVRQGPYIPSSSPWCINMAEWRY